MTSSLQRIKAFSASRAAQSAALFASLVGSMGMLFLSSLVTTRALGPAGYGDVKFIQTIWALVTLLVMAGFHQTGSYVLLKEKDSQRAREIIGTVLVGGVGMGAAIGLICAVAAYPIDWIFRTNLARVMIVMSPLVVGLPIQAALLLICQSTNQIYRLAFLNILPSALYLLSVVISPRAWLAVDTVLALQQITILVVAAGVILTLKPRFVSIRKWGREIQRQHKSYGWPIYLGMLAGVATGQLNRLAISYWVDNQAVGFFSVAVTLTDPLKLIPNAVATSSFKEFSKQRRISAKITMATIATSALAFVGALVFLGEPLSWLYTKAFADVSLMGRVAALGAVVFGFGDFYNRFLGAHGKGTILRNTAVLVGCINVVGFFIFVPMWGAWGAIIANVVLGFAYSGVMYWSYRKHAKSLEAAALQPVPTSVD